VLLVQHFPNCGTSLLVPFLFPSSTQLCLLAPRLSALLSLPIVIPLSKCACTMIMFSSSSYTIMCCMFLEGFQLRFSFLLMHLCIVFKSVCRVFISWVPFNHSVILIVFCCCFNSCMATLISSSCWSNCWTFSSSSKMSKSA
jgi:hypothetical protein